MSCPAIHSGSQFLSAALAHIDCQARNIGSYGYGALADPSSTVSIALTGMLTIFVAVFGMRLLGGYVADGRDAMSDFLKLGIVLLLATGWPAWRVIAYDVVLDGPSEIAQTISGGPNAQLSGGNVPDRLQKIDDGLVAITALGSGRLPGADLRDEFRGIALADETGFAWGRVIFLLGVLAPYAMVRLGAGILLSLAPLLACSLLFGSFRGIFDGWIRSLAFAMLGSLAITLLQEVSLAILEPWLANIAQARSAGILTPSAPTEMTVMSLMFATTVMGVIALLARLTFMPYFGIRNILRARVGAELPFEVDRLHPALLDDSGLPRARAHVVADSVAAAVRREKMAESASLATVMSNSIGLNGASDRLSSEDSPSEILGSKYRRDHRRSTTSMRRDQKR